jgi:hypothetical protein
MKKWKSCRDCKKWNLVGRLGKEGVCEYMTGYNQQVVYTPPNFRCIKHKDRVSRGDNK